MKPPPEAEVARSKAIGGFQTIPELQREAREVIDERARLEKAREFGAIDWSMFEGRQPPPRTWWIQDWLSPAPTLCSGGGGIGKSILWQTIGAALATGREFLGASVKPLRVLIWACEDDENEIWRRQVTICEHLGVGMRDLGGLSIMPRLGADNTLLDLTYGTPTFTPEFVSLREQVNDLRADVAVFDNIGQVYGGNENDRHQVTMFVNGVLGMVRGRPFAPVFLGHPARSPGSEYSGNAAWENACRMRWFVDYWLPNQRPKDAPDPAPGDPIYLCKRKTNYSERDYRRLYYRNGLFVPETCQTGHRFDAKAQEEIAEAIVMKGLTKLTTMGKPTSDARTSTNYLPRLLLQHKLHEDRTRDELGQALIRLMNDGRLKIDTIGKKGNRTNRDGLVAVNTGPDLGPDEDIPF